VQFNLEMPPMTDPHAVADVFASGLGEIEDVGGGCYRFTLFAPQRIGGREQFVVVARVIVPTSALPGILFLAGRSIGLSVVRAGAAGALH
jgi:hypothetical protein